MKHFFQKKRIQIRWSDVRNHLVFTIGAFVVLGSLYTVFSVFIYRGFIEPIIPLGSDLSRVLYAFQGLLLFLLVEPTKKLLFSVTDYILTKRFVQYRVVREELAAALADQSTVEKAATQISRILKDSFSTDSVDVVVRFEGVYYRVGEEEHERLQLDHPVVEFCGTQPDVHDLYARKLQAEKEAITEYMNTNAIQYILPLVVEKQLLGWIELTSKKKKYRLSYNDRLFLRSIQVMLAIGLRRTTLQRHLEKRVEELTTLQHIGHTMNSSLNVNETIESVMDAVIELSGADRALMYLKTDDGLEPTIGRGIDDGVNLDFVIDIEKSVFKWVFENRQPLVVEDVYADERVNIKYAENVKSKSFIGVPVVSKEEVLGIIGVDNLHSGRSIHGVQLPILATLASNLSIALANSTLFEKTQAFNEQLQTEIDEATEHLQALLEMKSHFLTLASHQLRTPTTIVKGLLSMLEEDPDMPQDEQRKLIEQAFLSTRRLERIISELLSATELEDTTIKPVIEEFDLAELLETICKELRPLAEKCNIELHMEHDEALHTVHSDQYKLKEAITNLIDNALRYTQEGGVTVKALKEGENCVIQIVDTGIGLSKEDQAVIFEKFRRGAEVSDIEPNGSGLGLFIAKRIVEVLSGTISVTSQGKGKGSTFAISFPIR